MLTQKLVQQPQEASLLRYELLSHCCPALLPLSQQLLQLVRLLLLPLQQQSLLGTPAQCPTEACRAMQLAIAVVGRCAHLKLTHRCLMCCCRFASGLLLLLLHLAAAASQLHRLMLLSGCCCQTQKSLLHC
jgi:hypothetical protein